MRSGLAPYAVGALLVVVVSVAALAGALAAGGLLEERAPADDGPSPSAARAPVELSRTGRLAYWRADPKGGYQLWVANIDGTNRRALARTTVMSSVDTMRWSPDGNALAYIDRGRALVTILRLDGTQTDLRLNASIVALDSRLTGLAWSTDAHQVATTLRSSSGSASDVYVASVAGGEWRNVTGLGDAFLSQWISATELLVHTQGGMIAVQRVDGTGIVPLTSQSATSPFLGDDGRVYFLAGQIAPTIRDGTLPVVNASQARVWSTTVDAGEPRLETAQRYDDIRLVGRWPNGPFIANQGASTALSFLGAAGIPPIDQRIGIVERVVFSPDRRTAIGLTFGRIDRYDTAHPDSPVVLLSDVFQPDAWYPSPLPTAVRASPSPAARPAPSGRFTFAMHGLVWVTDSRGVARVIAKLESDDRSLRRLGGSAIPQWSPSGDHVLFFDVQAGSFAGAAYVSDLTAATVQFGDRNIPIAPFPTWTPDGHVAYAALLGTRDSASFGSDAEIRVGPPSARGFVALFTGREVAFGAGKTYLIDNGQLSVPLQTRVGHELVEVSGATRRTITTPSRLATDPRVTGTTGIGLRLTELGISADGGTLSVRMSPANG
ncbi:MAG TPA: hypothetical protein VGA38_09275, partial [Candidatus Limnocylindria bacterium]